MRVIRKGTNRAMRPRSRFVRTSTRNVWHAREGHSLHSMCGKRVVPATDLRGDSCYSNAFERFNERPCAACTPLYEKHVLMLKKEMGQ